MSIASRVSGYWGEKLYPEGFILIEPKVGEKAIALIINDEFEAAEELARPLLVLERGIEAEIPPEGPGRCPATRDTIALMIELAYLESKPYHCSLKRVAGGVGTFRRSDVSRFRQEQGRWRGSVNSVGRGCQAVGEAASGSNNQTAAGVSLAGLAVTHAPLNALPVSKMIHSSRASG